MSDSILLARFVLQFHHRTNEHRFGIALREGFKYFHPDDRTSVQEKGQRKKQNDCAEIGR